MSADNINPCPFCGSPAEWQYRDFEEDTELGDDGTGWIVCLNRDCGTKMFDAEKDEAIKRWNSAYRIF